MLADASLPLADPWRHAFRLSIEHGRCRVRSAGLDGVFDTCDDVSADSMPHWRP